MDLQESLQIFDNRSIRSVWDEELQERCFSVLDVCGVLTDSPNPRNYWKVLKHRLIKEGDKTVTNCNQLKLIADDGKMRLTDVATREQIVYLTQSVSSTKTATFIQWLEQYGGEQDNHGLSAQRSKSEVFNGEIVLYQADDSVNLEVRLENGTVWLTQAQIIELFQSSKGNISEHIKNIYEQGELEEEATVRDFRTVQTEGGRTVTRTLTYYNLDVIISVGFRVNAKRGVRFRQWANRVLKNYLLRGYAINQRLLQMEQRIDARLDAHIGTELAHFSQIESTLAEHQEKIDFFVRTNQPPVEGIFYDGQIFDAYRFVSDLIRKAKRSVILIDNYVDDTVLTLLDKRADGVTATIYTQHISQKLQLDLDRHNTQYAPIVVEHFNRAHDRFLLIDDEVYHIGASLKDLGKRWFAFTLMRDLTAVELTSRVVGSATVNIEE